LAEAFWTQRVLASNSRWLVARKWDVALTAKDLTVTPGTTGYQLHEISLTFQQLGWQLEGLCLLLVVTGAC
jgi:hypothetical protein